MSKKVTRNNVMSDFLTYDVNDLIFDAPVLGKMIEENPDNKKKKEINYYRIPIKTRNPDGSEGELLFGVENASTFGISTEYKTISLRLHDGNPSERQSRSIQVFNDIIERCKDFLIENRKVLDKPKLERSGLSEFNVLKFSKKSLDENGDPLPGSIPSIKLKMLPKKVEPDQPKDYRTYFTIMNEVDDKGKPLEIHWSELIDKRCIMTALIQIEGIFVGSTVMSLQLKIKEGDVRLEESGQKRFLRNAGIYNVLQDPSINIEGDNDSLMSTSTNSFSSIINDNNDSNQIITEEDEEDEEDEFSSPPPPVITTVKGNKKGRK